MATPSKNPHKFVSHKFASHKFVHFGCWNQGVCRDESTPLHKVTEALKTFTRTESPALIVVAGDNYYPGKVKNPVTGEKIKTIIPADLIAGFSCLPQDVPIDMLLGNHDLETNMYMSGLAEKETDCFITQTEVTLAKNLNINLVVQKAELLDTHTLLLLIDTSMYDDEDIGEMLPCYKKMTGYAGITDKEALRAQQLAFVQGAVEAFKGENIILVGHHPLTGYKLKKDQIKLITAFPSFLEMLKNLFALKGLAVKYYYLCADLHLYQEGTVTLKTPHGEMQIHQYIVGTGGTELDPDPRAGFKPTEEVLTDLNYTMTPEQQTKSMKAFGFLVCDFHNPKNLTFQFIRVPDGPNGGKKKRSRKTRSRKSMRKSMRKSRSRKSMRKSQHRRAKKA